MRADYAKIAGFAVEPAVPGIIFLP